MAPKQMDAATAAKLAESRRQRALTKFRATLPPEDSELDICPPDCARDHDAEARELASA